jgi:hypothetical protein
VDDPVSTLVRNHILDWGGDTRDWPNAGRLVDPGNRNLASFIQKEEENLSPSPPRLPPLWQFFILVSPLIGPFLWSFDWNKDMPRPVKDVKWWMGYPYWQV